jgi:hypothetical protein
MSLSTPRAALLAGLMLTVAVLGGCSNPDALTASTAATTTVAPRGPGEPKAPAAPSAVSQAPWHVHATPRAALTAFADLYINWSYKTLTATQRALAAMSVGAARLAEQQAAVTSQADTPISQGHIHNSGQVVSVAPDQTQAGRWVIVTNEQTGGDSQYEGLPAAYHVTLAQVAHVPGGYAISQWLPQS